ncbi:hypothetical protein BJY52DRAFT_1281484 [Lactarius psammicola]|nr:hypothetical protein BJY52DRAFT_1281484 [Lactarius psammicola]
MYLTNSWLKNPLVLPSESTLLILACFCVLTKSWSLTWDRFLTSARALNLITTRGAVLVNIVGRDAIDVRLGRKRTGF